MRKSIALGAAMFAAAAAVYAQSAPAKVEPVFSSSVAGMAWVEAERATATNFAGEATLDYGSSGYKVLQLNREGRSAAYYAEYGFVLDSGGTWSLWIGGTPPGPQSELQASFVSPIVVSIDGGAPEALYRERVEVNSRYSTNNYWFVAQKTFALGAGTHTLRFEITEARKYDSRCYFSLDAFFLLEAGSPARTAGAERAGLPAQFPKDLDDRSIDQPYLSIPQYEYAIQTAPKDKERYLLLAQVYSLIGDHGSAIKTLARGRVVAGDDIRFTLQMAKSRIWSGEIDEGLRLYREYLASPGADPTVWAEAAKISAWLMKYPEAEALYKDALAQRPGDLNLEVNYGLTLLWQSRGLEGEKALESAWLKGKEHPRTVAELASIYMVSGYPDRARTTYERGIKLYPDELELYLSLADLFALSDKPEEFENVIKMIDERFSKSERLDAVIAAKRESASLRDKALAEYRAKLDESPDNLELRLELLKAYYWNGMLGEALGQADEILVNKLYTVLQGLEEDLVATYRLIDSESLMSPAMTMAASESAALAKSLRAAGESLLKAKARSAIAEKGKDAKRAEKAATELEAATVAATAEQAKASSLVEWAEQSAEMAESLIADAAIDSALRDADQALLDKLAPWAWNIDRELAFLASLGDGNALAAFARERIASLAGKDLPSPSAELAAFAPAGRIAAQATLWKSGKTDFEAIMRTGYYPYLDGLAETAAALSWEPPAEPEAGGYDGDASRELAARLDAVAAKCAGLVARVSDSKRSLFARAEARLRARMYQYDTETQADRRELADVYLRLGKPAEAAESLARVLAVNPSDSASMFTLGRAREIAGDWNGAMSTYREVYDLNPRYESAVSSYNRLAGVHAATLESDLVSVVDSSESVERATLSYDTPINSAIVMNASYTMTRMRVHAPASGAFPVSAALHTVELGLPWSLTGTGFTLRGTIGGTVKNKLGDFLPPDASEFSWDTIGGFIETAPRLGAGASWEQGPWQASLEYSFSQVEDTFYSDRLPYYAHKGDAYASWFKTVPSRDLARTLSLRAGGSLSNVAIAPGSASYAPDAVDNLLWSASLTASEGNRIGKSGRLTVDLSLSISYEDSTHPEAEDYYSPSEVLVVKGGPSISLAPEGTPAEGIGFSARLWPGYYAASGDGRPYFDGELELSSRSSRATMYLRLGVTYAAASDASSAWWSGQVGVGAKIRLGDYIIP